MTYEYRAYSPGVIHSAHRTFEAAFSDMEKELNGRGNYRTSSVGIVRESRNIKRYRLSAHVLIEDLRKAGLLSEGNALTDTPPSGLINKWYDQHGRPAPRKTAQKRLQRMFYTFIYSVMRRRLNHQDYWV